MTLIYKMIFLSLKLIRGIVFEKDKILTFNRIIFRKDEKKDYCNYCVCFCRS